jgi:hypothetical protein
MTGPAGSPVVYGIDFGTSTSMIMLGRSAQAAQDADNQRAACACCALASGTARWDPLPSSLTAPLRVPVLRP